MERKEYYYKNVQNEIESKQIPSKNFKSISAGEKENDHLKTSKNPTPCITPKRSKVLVETEYNKSVKNTDSVDPSEWKSKTKSSLDIEENRPTILIDLTQEERQSNAESPTNVKEMKHKTRKSFEKWVTESKIKANKTWGAGFNTKRETFETPKKNEGDSQLIPIDFTEEHEEHDKKKTFNLKTKATIMKEMKHTQKEKQKFSVRASVGNDVTKKDPFGTGSHRLVRILNYCISSISRPMQKSDKRDITPRSKRKRKSFSCYKCHTKFGEFDLLMLHKEIHAISNNHQPQEIKKLDKIEIEEDKLTPNRENGQEDISKESDKIVLAMDVVQVEEDKDTPNSKDQQDDDMDKSEKIVPIDVEQDQVSFRYKNEEEDDIKKSEKIVPMDVIQEEEEQVASSSENQQDDDVDRSEKIVPIDFIQEEQLTISSKNLQGNNTEEKKKSDEISSKNLIKVDENMKRTNGRSLLNQHDSHRLVRLLHQGISSISMPPRPRHLKHQLKGAKQYRIEVSNQKCM